MQKYKRNLISLLLIAALSMTAFVVAADDEEETDPAFAWVEDEDMGRMLTIADGRVNGVDVAAPVAIYYTYEEDFMEEGAVANGVRLLGIDPETNNGYLVLDASVDDIEQLASGAVESLSADGFSLYYVDGYFTVVAPADYEGKVYSYTWENKTLELN